MKSNVEVTRNFPEVACCELDSKQASIVILDLIEAMKLYRNSPRLDFNGNDLTDDDYHLWTVEQKAVRLLLTISKNDERFAPPHQEGRDVR